MTEIYDFIDLWQLKIVNMAEKTQPQVKIGHYIIGDTLGVGTFGKVKSKVHVSFYSISNACMFLMSLILYNPFSILTICTVEGLIAVKTQVLRV